jgi:hypothetical protein
MKAYTHSYSGRDVLHILPDRVSLIALRTRANSEGLRVVRLEVSSEEASALMVTLTRSELNEWVQFGTWCGIPFVLTKEDLCYSI